MGKIVIGIYMINFWIVLEFGSCSQIGVVDASFEKHS